ncbi:MAG: methyltransferase domain-containing protein [Oleiphilaceae bacterium]|nr:methyltransferase domain-containing protein [Oleiphilaceae bacterium]
MKLPLGGDPVYQTADALGNIQVIDQRKHRILRFDSLFEQSKIDRRRPYLPVHEYNRAMLLPVAFREPRHATVLGLGGGVLVSALHHLLPECGLHAVELRREVVIVARQFFDMPKADNIRITIADARVALSDMTDASTDLILTDLYNAERMSPFPNQPNFLDQCDRVLSARGWLAINYHRPPDFASPLFQHMRRLFTSVQMFKSKTNNYVVYASRQDVEPLAEKDPGLAVLEEQLPIDWQRLMNRVQRIF